MASNSYRDVTNKTPIKYSYTCQKCNREIESAVELEFIKHLLPLCSQVCKYQVIYDVLFRYREKELQKLAHFILNKETSLYSKNVLLLELSKKYCKLVLPNIKPKLNNSTAHSTKNSAHVQKPNISTAHILTSICAVCCVLKCAMAICEVCYHG